MRNNHIICPLCGEPVNKLVYRFHIEGERTVIEKIRQENPAWTEKDGICSRCVDYYQTRIVLQQQILPEIGPHFPVKSPDDFIILPASLRMDADPRFTGKGVTICFIDSGFFPHADLVASRNRIKAMINIADSGKKTCDLAYSQPHSWHGTMTSVVCAGDGYMSKGLYKGIASEADLVLLKVQDDEGRITTENLVKALQWVLANHEFYNIRVVNMSVYDDCSVSYKASLVDQLAEELIGKGIVVVAAVGNKEDGEIKPPGNSLNVIAVGGI
ncbi:MAG TPA: S8 family serine peptidase, partial [Chitinophagaceae bacterium]